ncbi:MAG: vWA domain-containing protein [bacterium]|nr:vWA domain-containing protein [bacterium]
MMFTVHIPWMLVLLALALLPFFWQKARAISFSSLAALPRDKISTALTYFVRAVSALTIVSLVLGMAGLSRPETVVWRIGTGAQCVLLFDESDSMNEPFAGSAGTGKFESKMDATRRLALEYVANRPHDVLAVAAFGSSAIYVLSFTERKEALIAAVKAQAANLWGTSIDVGLFMALSFFENEPIVGSRCVIFFSDGGGAIRDDFKPKMRELFARYQVRLYWIFVRSPNERGPFDVSGPGPLFSLANVIYQSLAELGAPLKAYDAMNPNALREALADVDKLEKQPIPYKERVPRQDYSGLCYSLALILTLILIALKLMEVRQWRHKEG